MSTNKVGVSVITCILTLVVGFLALNFMPSEKQIETQLTRQYDIHDGQFRRSMSAFENSSPIVSDQ
jgi:hypothetical protein